jgi:hypothetical protein
MKQPKYFLIITALCEAGTGCLALVSPSLLLVLLLGVDQSPPEVICLGRVAGAALLAIGVSSWFGRSEEGTQAQQGLLIAILIYDLAAGATLAYTGAFLHLAGIALWPAVVLHAALAIWCVACMRRGGAENRPAA